LEDRRLLAADVAVVELAPVENFEPEICQVSELDSQVESEGQGETLDLDSTEIPVDVIDSVEDQTASDLDFDVETEADVDVVATETSANDLGDPVDGTDGFFGSIDAENPTSELAFSPSEDGIIDIVVASSFDGAETRLEVSDSNGDIVTSTITEDLTGFQKLSFEATAGETYQLNVSSEDGAEGYFQVTVDHNEIPEPVDLHADTIGEDSTQLELVDGNSEITGELELAGDVDTFRFTADSNGKALLGLTEADPENSSELQIQVLNADGDLLTRGITNETVGVSFDIEDGAEYFLAVSAAEGQTGVYGIDLTVEDAVDVEPEPVVDDQPVDDQPIDADSIADADQGADVDPVVDGDPIVDGDPVADVDPVVDLDPVDTGADADLDPVDGDTVVGVDTVADVDPVDDSTVDDQPIDDVVADVVELEFVDGVASVEGELEAGVEPAEFQFVAEADGEVGLALETESEGNDADASVAVFDANNEPVVDGTTNDDVGILFDVVAGDSYQVVVDSLNDIPVSYELTATLTETESGDDIVSVIEEIEDDLVYDLNDIGQDIVSDDAIEDVIDSTEGSVDDLIDEVNGICFSDVLAAEGEAVDSFFAEFNPESIFRVGRGFGLRG